MAQHGISSIDMVPGKVIERLPYGNPEFCQPHRVYAVAEGDTVYNITRQFNVTVEQIKEVNDLNEQNLIYSTQILCIP